MFSRKLFFHQTLPDWWRKQFLRRLHEAHIIIFAVLYLVNLFGFEDQPRDPRHRTGDEEGSNEHDVRRSRSTGRRCKHGWQAGTGNHTEKVGPESADNLGALHGTDLTAEEMEFLNSYSEQQLTQLLV